MNAWPRPACALVLASVLSGCASLPPYRPPMPSAQTAVVDVSRISADAICVDSTVYEVGEVAGGKLIVPTDSRIALHSFVYIADYDVNYSCYPGISFQPRAGAEYLMNLEVGSSACRLEVYRKDEAAPVGLALVPSIGPSTWCGKPRALPPALPSPPPPTPGAPPVQAPPRPVDVAPPPSRPPEPAAG